MLINHLSLLLTSSKASLAIFFLFAIGTQAFGQFVHPGISHKRSDLERMKLMIEAGAEPWASSFEYLRTRRRAQHDFPVGVLSADPSFVIEFNQASDNFLINEFHRGY